MSARALCAVALLAGTAAWPCSGPESCPPLNAFAVGLPANTPGFPLERRRALDPDGGPGLTLADGGAVPGTTTDKTVKPDAPLVAGETYTLHDDCGFGPLPLSFTAGPALALPTKSGTLTRTAQGWGRQPVPGGSRCLTEADVAYAKFDISPAPELVPFLAVTSWTLEIDGKWGWASTSPGADPSVQLSSFRRLNFVHSTCGAAGPQYVEAGLPSGPHVARLRAQLAGGEPLEAAEAEFTLECGHGCGCGAGTGPLGALALLAWFLCRAIRR